MNRREWYARVNSAWPAGPLPKLEPDEAVRAARRLLRLAGLPAVRVTATSGNRENWGHTGGFRVNPSKGWHDLVHGIAHWAHYVRNRGRGVAPHDKTHARLELRLVKAVVARGYLEGKLKTAPRKPAPAVPTLLDEKDAALQHARKMLAKAVTRAKRAETIRAKWARKVRARERALAMAESRVAPGG